MSGTDAGRTGLSTLDVFDFGVLLQALAQSQREGTLRVFDGVREKYVCLRAGRVEAIYTPRSRYRIGRILYNSGAVELADLHAALAAQRDGKTTLSIGDWLLERGLVTREQVEEALRYQVVEELIEVFHWKGMSYEFFAGPPEKCVEDRVSGMTRVGGAQDANGVLLQVTKILDDLDKYNRETPSLKDVYEITRDPEEYLARLRDREGAGAVLALIDGVRDMGDLIQEVRLNRFEAMEVLYRLRAAGLIRAKNAFELFMLAESGRRTLPASSRARLYERIAELGIQGFDISYRRAEVYEELQRFEEAADEYEAHARKREGERDLIGAAHALGDAVRVTPGRIRLREERGRVLATLGKTEEAAEELRAAARLYRESGDREQAEAALARAQALRPGDGMLFSERFASLIEMGQGARAARLAIAAARERERERDLSGARLALATAIRAAPDRFRPRAELAALLTRSGDRSGAVAALGEAVPAVLGRCAGRPERAARMLAGLAARIEALGGVATAAMFTVAEARLRVGRRDEGLALLVRVGEARVAAGDLLGAREAYALASRTTPADLDLAETLALLNARVGQREPAIARLRGIAALYRQQNRPDRAERAYHEILRLDPFSADALQEMAKLRTEQGNRKEAAALCHRLGSLRLSAGDLEAAAAHFEEACRLDPTRPEHVRALADALGKALRAGRATEPLESVLAMLLARRDHTAAVDVAFRILALSPGHARARTALSEAIRGLSDRAATV